MPKVVLTSSKVENLVDKNIDSAVAKAITQIDYDFKSKIKNVVIKPNLCYYWDYSTGETTDPRVVSAVIDYLRGLLGKDISISIAEADASAMKTKYSFKVLGYDTLSKIKKVDLVNLSEGKILPINVRVGEKKLELPVNDALLKADLIVNVPKLKVHNIMGVTCALKNMFGAIAKPRKYTYHNILSHVIVGINKIVKSHITVVDGVIGRGTHPQKLGVIMAGDDPVAMDFTAAEIMGFNPRKIQYLNLAAREQIGQMKNIQLVQDQVTLEEIRKKFPRRNYTMHKVLWNLQLKMLRLYAAVVGDVLPPVLEE